MKRFPVLLFLCLLLTGCAAYGESSSLSPLSESQAQIWASYDPDSTLEKATGGALRTFSFQDFSCTGLLGVQDQLLLFSASETSTFLAMLDPVTGIADTGLEISFPLTSQDTSIHLMENGFSCYDPITRQTLVIDNSLQITRKIPAPEGLVGSPILSQDGNTLYYCTENAIRCLDLSCGISRIMKESADSGQQVQGLLRNDSILICRRTDQSWLFLSTETGSTLGTSDNLIESASFHDSFLGFVQEGNLQSAVFQLQDQPMQMLILPDWTATQYLLPERQAVLTAEAGTGPEIKLHHYDLFSGQRSASLQLEGNTLPRWFTSTEDGSIWFVHYDVVRGCDILCRWDPAKTPTNDEKQYIEPYYTRVQPDASEIDRCLQYASQLSQRFGIEILVYKDADDFQPQDLKLSYEHLAPVLQWELQQLEQNLSNYPPELLQTLITRFDGLRICILRSITPLTSESGTDTNGVSFWNGHQACIALAAGTDTTRGLYHELCHLMDTIVLNESSAYDTWNQLNPTGFEYDYDYGANLSRNSTAFLLDSSRYFVDMYAMSFPKEDRARIMEYAMTPGNVALFQTDTMQAKLRTLCFGIREAFRLKDSPEIFLWEQYLHTSLAAKE